jgi:hypothetical protein
MPLQETSGNLTTDAFGGGVAAVPKYIEDVFSTWLYDGNGTSQTITNNINLSTKGGLVWVKGRNLSWDNTLYDTVNGVGIGPLNTATTAAPNPANNQRVTAFNTNGFSLGTNGNVNGSTYTYVSWTFQEQPKFFDVVTYTGTGSNTTIAHNLGSVPGSIIIKRTDTTADWAVYHRSLANTQYLVLNTTAAAATGATWWNSTTPTSAVFSVGTDASVNASGGTYVAYLFAHNAGGFGLTGTDNVISCGSYTGNGSTSGPTVTLGYEPQWLMVKKTSNATNSNWFIVDNMRGFTATGGDDAILFPNLSNAESPFTDAIAPNATGFQLTNTGSTYNESGSNYIYIAIRRGPMKVPTDATKVFVPLLKNNATGTSNTTGFPVDFQIVRNNTAADITLVFDRLRGVSSTPALVSSPSLDTTSTGAETSDYKTYNWNNTSFGTSNSSAGLSEIYWNMGRAPSFFDEVCYTGNYASQTLTHNLGAVPEMFILKNRTGGSDGNWIVYHAAVGNTAALQLNLTATPSASNVYFNSTSPTSTQFTIGTNQSTGGGATYVAYLFATCAGVSKVGSYTGNGTTQTINCGFTGGARFVLLKVTSTTGGWYVYDTARGMTTLTDPYLFMNATTAEAATLGSVTTVSTGFALNESILAGINTSGQTYIFLAIA